MNEVKRTAILLFLYSRNELTPKEQEELQTWREESRQNEKLFRLATNPKNQRAEMRGLYKCRDRGFEKLKKHIPQLIDETLSDPFSFTQDPFAENGYTDPVSEPDYNVEEIHETEISQADYWNSMLSDLGITDEQLAETERLGREWGATPLPVGKPILQWRSSLFTKMLFHALYVLIFFGVSYYFVSRDIAQSHRGAIKAAFLSFDGVSYELSYAFSEWNSGYKIGKAGFTLGTDKEGKALFIAPDHPKASKVKFNTIITGSGDEFPVQFPDGTRMWINAGSRVEYPANFDSDTIDIQLDGEAYIEVPPRERTVVRIYMHGSVFQTRGAIANIWAYAEEPVYRTTLIKGSAGYRVYGKDAGHPIDAQLLPGEQAQVRDDVLAIFPSANMKKALAWRRNRILFAR